MTTMYGICNLPVIPMRKIPKDTGEMVSQLLFGEYFKIGEERSGYVKVQNVIDAYEGFIDKKQFVKMPLEDIRTIKLQSLVFTKALFSKVKIDNSSFYIPSGSIISTLKTIYPKLNYEDHFFGKNVGLKEYTLCFLGTPYLWGGRTCFGIDCSGFTQIAMRSIGIHILRDAYQQASQGVLIKDFNKAKAFDLAFFHNKKEAITHVGILLSKHEIIHASGCVRMDKLDVNGIFNVETQSYTHVLHSIRRFINKVPPYK